MKKSLSSKIIASFALLVESQFALANTIVTVGDQDFTDESTMNTGPFLAAGAGEPAPFDGVFVGLDVSGPDFSASWIR